MAHIGTVVDRAPLSRRGGGGSSSVFAAIAFGLAAVMAGVSVMLPPLSLIILSSLLLISGFGLAAITWRRTAAEFADGVTSRDVAGLLVLLGFIGVLIGETGYLVH